MSIDPTLQIHKEAAVSADKFYADTGLAIIEVKGADAAKFLQGQLTCNVNELSMSLASICGFCNAKGQVISTLVLIKTSTAFLLVLPVDLLEKVIKKLRIYILRSAVELLDRSGELQVLGLESSAGRLGEQLLPTRHFGVEQAATIVVKLPDASRYWVIADHSLALASLLEPGVEQGDLAQWRLLDIKAGFPWFDVSQSEQYIPQMLNIDQWGGISFNKGCYTGQEVIARVHYLGKIKRGLFVAESCGSCVSGCSVLDLLTGQVQGAVLAAQRVADKTLLLLVMQIVDGEQKHFILDDGVQTPLSIISDH